MMHFNLLLFLQLILETLPLSSSTHLWLINWLFSGNIESSAKSLGAAYQLINLPTILVIGVFFRQRIWDLLSNQQILFACIGQTLLINIITSIAHVTYNYFYGIGTNPTWELVCGLPLCAAMLYSTKCLPTSIPGDLWSLSFNQCLLVGLLQFLASFRGISRFGMTWAGLVWCGMPGGQAVFFSFCLYVQLSLGLLFYCFARDCGDLTNLLVCDRYRIFSLLAGLLISYQGLRLSYYLATHEKFYYFAYYYILPFCAFFLIYLFN